MLMDFPIEADPLLIGNKVANRFLSRPHSNTGTWYTEEEKMKGKLFNEPVGYIVYPDVCAWHGAFSFACVSNDVDLQRRLINRADKIILGSEQDLIPVANHVDNNIFGTIPLEAYEVNKDSSFLKIGLYMADEQFKKLSDKELSSLSERCRKWYEEGLSWNTRMWIDDMYMITLLQTRAYQVTGDGKYLDRAAKQMVAYLNELQEPNGLFHHADDVPIYWGRGNGWMAAGMTELLSFLPKHHMYREEIMSGYKKMMKTLLDCQDKSGMWHQILDDPNAWPETSGTGMFTFAFIAGVKRGWLEGETYASAARKAWIALCSYINAQGDISNICIGTNKKNDYQYYLDREKVVGDLHGQAPVLWCASELLKK